MSPGLFFSESSEPSRLALIAVPVLRGIVTAGPCWTCFFSRLLSCPMVPPASIMARSATPSVLVFIGGLLLRAGGQDLYYRQYHLRVVQRQFQSVTPLVSMKNRSTGTPSRAHFAVLVPVSYRVRSAFLGQIV